MKSFFTCIFSIAVLVAGCFSPVSSVAYETARPRSGAELTREGATSEIAQHIVGASVAWADYGRILRDFPTLGDDLKLDSILSLPLSERSTPFALDLAFTPEDKAKLDSWLLSQCAFIGSKQKKLDGVRNTKIPVDPALTKAAYRPTDWFRAAVLEVESPKTREVLGTIDVKGIGHGERSVDWILTAQVTEAQYSESKRDAVRTSGHSDGLMSLGEAGAEVTRQRALQTILERREIPFETVESYAIIRLPFGIYKEQNRTLPAALYLRQSHFGRWSGLDVVPNSIYRDPPGGKQFTDSWSIVDFGGVLIPDPALGSHFGPSLTSPPNDPQFSKPWAWAHEAASAADPSAMRIHIEQMDEAVKRGLDAYGLPSGTWLSKSRNLVSERVYGELLVKWPDVNSSAARQSLPQARLFEKENLKGTFSLLRLWFAGGEERLLSPQRRQVLSALLGHREALTVPDGTYFAPSGEIEGSLPLLHALLEHYAFKLSYREAGMSEFRTTALRALVRWSRPEFEARVRASLLKDRVSDAEATDLLGALSAELGPSAFPLYLDLVEKILGSWFPEWSFHEKTGVMPLIQTQLEDLLRVLQLKPYTPPPSDELARALELLSRVSGGDEAGALGGRSAPH